MHELSLAESLYSLINESIVQHKLTYIKTIEIEIGELAQVDIESLLMYLTKLSENSVAADATVHVKTVEAWGCCESCRHEFRRHTLYDPCPRCEETAITMISGQELNLTALEAK